MQASIEKYKRFLRYVYLKSLRRARPVLEVIRRWYAQMNEYFRTHPRQRRWAIVASVVFGPLFLFLLVVWIEIPSKRELREIHNHVASEVYSADSVLLGRYYIQDRTEVAYEDIAPVVIDAVIATEDVRFFKHEGVDFESLGRVLVKSILLREESSGGGSTITQQLAKNLYPRKRYWVLSMLINKFREIITARRLERLYSKRDLITMYLNTIPFADQTFGIEAAAKRFFSVSAKDLTIDQAAVLVGMLKATYSYNPRLFPERALERRNVVLSQMAKYDFIEEDDVKSLKKKPLGLKYNMISHHQGLAPYFREFLKTELQAWCKNHSNAEGDPYNIFTDGLKIYTTIDSRMQAYAEKAVSQQMSELQKQFFDHWGKKKPWTDNEKIIEDAIRRTSYYKQLKDQGLSEAEVEKILQKKVPTKVFTWKGEQEREMSFIDSLKHHIQYLNAGFVVMEPQTGKVLAWVGGIEHDFFQYDHVKTSTKRQVGSVFKPIVYAAAIEKGIPPCEFVFAGRETYIDEEGEKWTPKNMQNDYEVEYSMKGALAYSVNTVAVKMIQRAGVGNTISLARRMGIASEMPSVPSISLGSSSISLLEMTTAYACIANDGVTSLPYFVTSIKDQAGQVYQAFKPENTGKRALSKETAQMVRSMLQTVVHEGTASRLRWRYGIYTDIAGKTGTTQSNADGWFMAFTPRLVVGAWVGADDPRIRFQNTQLGQGSNTALPIAGYFLKQVNSDKAFNKITQAKFQPLASDLQQKLSCDLYELNDDLWQQAQRTIWQRDSLLAADTTAMPPTETFLEKLYKRKLKIQQATQLKDSLIRESMQQLEELGG